MKVSTFIWKYTKSRGILMLPSKCMPLNPKFQFYHYLILLEWELFEKEDEHPPAVFIQAAVLER